MSGLIEQIDALLALNAKGAVSHRVPGLAVDLLERARAELASSQSQAEQIERLTREVEELQGVRNESAKLKGQRDAALARIKQMQCSNSRMAEGWAAITARAEAAEQQVKTARKDAILDARSAVRQALVDVAHELRGDHRVKVSSAMFKAEIFASNAIAKLLEANAAALHPQAQEAGNEAE